eukprot:TRINITY_DN2598_c0_g2_i1.p1 TRINITY_DN2598_c0_g2~~TRINITY_DN2598_c0_g2_i1.p1  ORF type:complete len:223 (+),score=41.08 TRINITY_DN2598_c0_g2_i1:150-818(+)
MEPTSQEFVKSDDFTWDDETKDDDLNLDSNVELDREWEARRNNFYTVGYREGLLAGKESSAQAGFNDGFKLSILHGYEWGIVRGLTSAFASLPEQLKNKLVESDVRTRVETLYGKVSSITGIDAQKYFYEDVLSGRVGTKLTNVNEYGQMRPSSGAVESDIQVSGEGRPLRSHVKKHSASSSETSNTNELTELHTQLISSLEDTCLNPISQGCDLKGHKLQL